MELQLLRLLSRFGYPGMFLLLTIESIFPPIPSEVVLTFGGFMTEHTSLTLTGMVIAATAGSTAGAMLLYLAGRLIPLERLERILSKRWIQKIGFKAEDLKKTLNWFDKHENTAVLIGRCVPVIRSLISIPAGMTRNAIQLLSLQSFCWHFYCMWHISKRGMQPDKPSPICQLNRPRAIPPGSLENVFLLL